MNYHKILVPIDFSTCSKKALEYAVSFAKATASKLILLHAYHVPLPVTETGILIDEHLAENFEKEAEIKFEELFKSFPALKDHLDSYRIKTAFAKDAILDILEEEPVKLILMGTHGAHGAFEEIVGSNTLHIIKKSRIPVLAIPEQQESFQIKEILFAFDYQTINSQLVIQPLIEFAKMFDAKVHVLYVTDKIDRLHKEAISEAKALEQYLKNTSHDYHMIEHKDIEQGIQTYIQNHPIDILAVMPRKHQFLQRLFKTSITKRLVHHSNIPLLTFPEK